jgi:hypothetical protein
MAHSGESDAVSCWSSLLSLQASVILRRASLLKNAAERGVKNGAKAILCPLKHVHHFLSPSHKKTTADPSDTTEDPPALTDDEDGVASGDEKRSSNENPEQQLGTSLIFGIHVSLLMVPS